MRTAFSQLLPANIFYICMYCMAYSNSPLISCLQGDLQGVCGPDVAGQVAVGRQSLHPLPGTWGAKQPDPLQPPHPRFWHTRHLRRPVGLPELLARGPKTAGQRRGRGKKPPRQGTQAPQMNNRESDTTSLTFRSV